MSEEEIQGKQHFMKSMEMLLRPTMRLLLMNRQLMQSIIHFQIIFMSPTLLKHLKQINTSFVKNLLLLT